MAVHLAFLGHPQRQCGKRVHSGTGSEEIAQRRFHAVFSIETDLHNDPAQRRLTICCRHAQHCPSKGHWPCKIAPEALPRSQVKIEILHVPASRVAARIVQPLSDLLDRLLQGLDLRRLERLNRCSRLIRAVIHMIIETAFVAGDLAAFPIRDREIEIPSLAVFTGDRFGQPRERAAQQVCHRRLNHRLLRAIQVHTDGPGRVRGPNPHHSPGALGVHHHKLLA
ncbi:hypothetical protein SDC9_151180 [bioreactor metagenome]|uniref:Uncharacterized protein n=1 Tax=bioreactor metagenome TaxID=1076179 RepID=A0A645EPK2_9ZZZZ